MGIEDKEASLLLARVLEKQDLVEGQVQELDEKIDKLLTDAIPGLRVEIAMLKVKSGLWGAAAGFVPVALTLVLQFLTR